MRRKGLEIAVVLMLSLSVVLGCSHASSGALSKPDTPIRILFIGNSYTYFNNLPRVLEALSASSNLPGKLETRMLAVGGARLSDHWEKGNAVKAIREEKWTYVVLQEQSALGGTYAVNGTPRVNRDPEMFYKYARMFDEEIKRAGAKTILFLTWARDGSPASEQAALNYAYVKIGKELGAKLAPVGVAWQAAQKTDPKLKLYVGDGSHPSPSGSYLAACVFYSLIHDKSPSGLTSTIEGTPVDHDGSVKTDKHEKLIDLAGSDAELIQRIAWQTAEATKAVGGYPAAPRPPPADELPKVHDW